MQEMAQKGTKPFFNVGEKVLCYEPDRKKMQLLYEAKVLGVYRIKDSNGIEDYEYKVHFQGWGPSWDSKVAADSLLKYNEENRELQRKLADKSNLHKTGGFTYKGRTASTTTANKKKRSRARIAVDPLGDDCIANEFETLIQYHHRPSAAAVQTGTKSTSGKRANDSSAGNSNKKQSTTQKDEMPMKTDDYDKEEDEFYMNQDKFNLKVEPNHRVTLQISERLREYLEWDREQIVKHGKKHMLPAHIAIVGLMEDFVRHRAVELAITTKKEGTKSRGADKMSEREVRDFMRVVSSVGVLKEVVDGIRIYFNFLIDKLLYEEERNHVMPYLSDDYIANFKYKTDSTFHNESGYTARSVGSGGADAGSAIANGKSKDVPYKRYLLHYVSIIASNSNGTSRHQMSPFDAAESIKSNMHSYLQDIFKWRMFPDDSAPDKSMVFGASHLARLFLKLPDYLNVSPMGHDKLEILLPHLNAFVNYLESRKELFSEQNYIKDEKLMDVVDTAALQKKDKDK